MGGYCSHDNNKEEFLDLDKNASSDVDNELMKDAIDQIFKFKVLLLGAGGSGKTTIMKQIKDLHGYSITDDMRKEYAVTLHNNVIDCMTALLTAVDSFGYELEETEKKTYDSITNRSETFISENFGKDILALFNGKACQDAYARRGKDFWLLDRFPYYIEHLGRFTAEPFVPTDDDCVMARIRTTGIQENKLEHKIHSKEPDEPSSLTFNVVDVGGQRSERKKWINCFDNVEAIIFVSNLADYRQVLYEDQTKNGMDESLELFFEVARNKNFRADVSLFLYLNKKDLFGEYVKKYGMKEQYPDYEGGNDEQAGLEYLTEKFKSNCPPQKSLSTMIITARVRKEIKAAFDDVKRALYAKHRTGMIEKIRELKKDHARMNKQNSGICC